MCGIIAYVGEQPAQDILLDGLSRLEYRGYDSAGIAVMEQGAIRLLKESGRLSHLRALAAASPLPGSLGIGHTRWATHGAPTAVNAHPHTDMTGRIAIVHNGIIENHKALRSHLQENGCHFVSETDSEVIAHLLGRLYEGDMLAALQRLHSLLEGSYALAVLSASEPDAVFCTRRDSPLAVGLSDQAACAASDIQALLPHTQTIDLLDDNEVAVLRRGCVRIWDASGRERAFRPVQTGGQMAAADKAGFPHYMLKEIHEQPQALQDTFRAYVNPDTCTLRSAHFPIGTALAQALRSMTIAACGTARHAGFIGKYMIEQLARLPVTLEFASEFRYNEQSVNRCELLLAISQSGETADTIAAIRAAGKRGAGLAAITNVPGSTITRKVGGAVMHTHAGPEISVASTKAYTTQLEALLLLAVDLALKRGTLSHSDAHQLLQELQLLPSLCHRVLEGSGPVLRFAESCRHCPHAFFIGRGADYALALEGALKLKEISYIHAQAYPAGELKHGVIALIEPGTPVVALLTQEHLAEKMLSNIHEVRSRGARVFVICSEAHCTRAGAVADDLMALPDSRSVLLPILAALPLQLFAYHMAALRGCDVDMPRNLAKSVTVE